jgi:predicted O-methyltransferase YrrM
MNDIVKEIAEKAKNVPGWFSELEVGILYPYISVLPENALFVEIGTYHGRSTLCWRLINPKIRILTNDICNQDGIGTQENQIKLGTIIPKQIDTTVLAEGNIFQVRGSSHDVVKTFNWPIDFLFIDSEHGYKDTIDTLNEWGKFVKPGHYIACHDYDPNGWPGVVNGIADYIKTHPNVNLMKVEGGVAILKV